MKIFQKKSNEVIEYKSLGGRKEFDYEKEIQNLIEKNLDIIFPSLEFLKTEHYVDKLRIDSVCFDIETQSFVIIEYKNVKHKGVLDQGMAYYHLLDEKRAAFVLLYQDIKGKSITIDNIAWDETRVIFISPEYTDHQKLAAKAAQLPIELWEIKKYEQDIFTLNKLETNSRSLKNVKTGKTERKKHLQLDEYSPEDYIEGKYDPRLNSEEYIKKLYLKLIKIISEKFSSLEFVQKKMYAGFKTEDGRYVCSFKAKKSAIDLYYVPDKEHSIPTSDFVKYSEKSHYGIGDFASLIINENDIQKAIPIIERIYQDKSR